ncbi:uncharacterized protein LOC130755917 [Actinidia eriantha]|uniref:uncharacterized protein LOC130755917 n=1 Tax=Actinidia eriantha TaxID=165200 RepID=UPI002590F95B|nr:uncharacterized protein LOC130755917 [Actinidia eriantha]
MEELVNVFCLIHILPKGEGLWSGWRLQIYVGHCIVTFGWMQIRSFVKPNAILQQMQGIIPCIVIVSNEEEKREFTREIGEEALPGEYGRAKLVAIQDVILTPLED